MIFDSKTVFRGATEGVSICLQVVIPSLLPFIICSNYLTASINNNSSIFLLGLLGGYPTGAQAVSNSYASGRISKTEAQQMLLYCNNAGPAFIFGMMSQLFQQAIIPWIIWIIHLLSAGILYIAFSKKSTVQFGTGTTNKTNLSNVITRSIKTISIICTWVFVFKVFLCVLGERLPANTPSVLRITITGLLELTNGCSGLFDLHNNSARFVLATAFVGFGGVCVLMQTASITNELGIKHYIIGKVLQCFISIILAIILHFLIFS